MRPLPVTVGQDNAAQLEHKTVIEYFTDMLCMGAAETKSDQSFEELCKAVAPIAKKYEVNRIYLFGSRARGENKGGSDYDFYVVLGPTKNLIKICGLLRELEETLGEKVDIVTDGAQLTEDFTQEVFRERRLVYGS